MVSDYRRKIVRNEVRRMIGKFHDEELDLYVKGITGFLGGYDRPLPIPTKEKERLLKRPNKNETTRY